MKIGCQIVGLGQGGCINPTDNLSPLDFTLLASEDGDLRYGNEALKASYAMVRDVFSAW